MRAKGGDPDVAVARGIELYEMGCRAMEGKNHLFLPSLTVCPQLSCRAMEVTMDSTDWERTIRGLRQALPQVLFALNYCLPSTTVRP